MVYIKRIELSHFKSFGGTTAVPFMPGFTVVSGPNGSGKSNILDALLFCLGLATSKGMRAERLPDLVNHTHSQNRNIQEALVSVTFDVTDLPDSEDFSPITKVNLPESNGNSNGHTSTTEIIKEWTVTRRLRVTKGGNYSSTYYINDEPCAVGELHEQLNRLRIYPEGYNVVLQGDVTRIINMNHKERREIIDELAGVAEFDRKIEKTRETLEEVREREERFRIIETELQRSLERLASDRVKAEKYQLLKAQIQQKQQWEAVLHWKSLQQQASNLQNQMATGEREASQLQAKIAQLGEQIAQTTAQCVRLNQQVKALGEDEQLSVASQLATHKAKRQQLTQRQQELATAVQQSQSVLEQTRGVIAQQQRTLSQLTREIGDIEGETLPFLTQERDRTRKTLEMVRQQANAIAESSDAWVAEQTTLSRKIATLGDTLNPQRTEQAQLTERHQQLQKVIQDQSQRLQTIESELESKQAEVISLLEQITATESQIQTLIQQLASAESDRSILQETQNRLSKEQREKQRQLDRAEASQQAQQEAQGTYATRILLGGDLPGVCGLVAQLGQVNPRYQLALEVAAGGRLGYVVVEDDTVAAAGIELLKQIKAGRATFLPLNKIKPPRLQDSPLLRQGQGFVDWAVNLILCEARYYDIFLYVFGNTAVFDTLHHARMYLGKQRIVTLDGDILETSGAMTGGSQPKRSGIHFGTSLMGESEEVRSLKRRLADLDILLSRNEEILLQKNADIQQLAKTLNEARQENREQQLHRQQIEKEISRLMASQEELNLSLIHHRQELETVQNRLQILQAEIPLLEARLQQEQQRLNALETSQTHSEWQQIQTLIKSQESNLHEREEELRQANIRYNDLQSQAQRLTEKIAEGQQQILDQQNQKTSVSQQQEDLQKQLTQTEEKIQETELLLAQLNEKLGETKKERDRSEESLRSLQNNHQQTNWQLEKLQSTQQERREQLQTLQSQIQSQQIELPAPIPEVPMLTEIDEKNCDLTPYLEQLQKEIRNGQKRLEAMEPVNMLALEEHEKTQERLKELSEKLSSLQSERTELLLRVENFTTLRFRAFKDAFDAVNENFQSIFAILSEGDGYLQLENSENPFEGGLNLVAHPKGKPVQRLSSMSGGEKSLTALSFIFSLQKYRPSPFYAFDEVDMFLDGSNVERLSKMIRHQAEQAQFIVVSLRRPMIEASARTIGVTQARGAHTQVLGIKL